jgi:hypothetical protein
MRILLVNPPLAECGVHQYGVRLSNVLGHSPQHQVFYSHAASLEGLSGAAAVIQPDVILYNWIDIIGGYLAGAPFRSLAKYHVLIYHDCSVNEAHWDAILFSDPTMPTRGKWFPIGRPLAEWANCHPAPIPTTVPKIGVNGLVGAWASLAVAQILREFSEAVIRLHLPPAIYIDPLGNMAREAAQNCRRMAGARPGIQFEISHEFLDQEGLMDWIGRNDLNVYIRDVPPGARGVSSVLDCAIAARRPVAVNGNPMFRHVFGLDPSIQVEHNSLRTIMANGIKPLLPLYEKWSAESVCSQVDKVISSL